MFARLFTFLVNVNPIIVFLMLCSADCSQLSKNSSTKRLKGSTWKVLCCLKMSTTFMWAISFWFKFPSSKISIFHSNFEELKEKLDYALVNIVVAFLLFVSKKVEHFLCQDFCNMFHFSASVREQIHQNNREGGLINVNPIIVFMMVCSRLPQRTRNSSTKQLKASTLKVLHCLKMSTTCL